ncbi:MAG: valine--tRNA ligase, partial [Halobacteria archaeon]|nr:valine--tRNA ligase [Halobacteria archaeon]
LVGETAKVPIFGQEVPVLEDERVEMEKGTGVVMCCTFGDQTDIEWYQAHDLPLRIAIDESGVMTERAGEYEGMTTREAREEIVEDLKDEGYLRDRREITHTVQVHERGCDVELEFLVTEQWYIKILDKKDEYLEAGREMDWYPEKMFTRYKHWIDGLQWDWCISRQRDSGIPFPVWYCTGCGHEIIADRNQLPVDPIEDEPPVDRCPECNHDEFVPEEDVLDTWATSSLTPLINAGWDGEEFERPDLYPMNLRPQGHDIISFWLFHTVVKCYEHTGEVPFESVMINGMVLDKNREAMSKSKGNVVRPEEVMNKFPVDAARYWAAGTSIGDDFPFKEKDLVAGEKLMRKIWNASKLVDQLTPDEEVDVDESQLEEIDRWMLAELDDIVEHATEEFRNYAFAKTRDRTRVVFWETFCDDYLEIAKQRLRDSENKSAEYALQESHKTFLKLFAPFLSHITEEVWREMYGDTSIHTTDWPEPRGIDADLEAGETAMEIISSLRKYKNERQLPLNEELDVVEVYGKIDGFEKPIQDVMHVRELRRLDEEPQIQKTISEINLDYAKVGPKYGDKVQEMEKSIEAGDFTLENGELRVAGVSLESDLFEVKEDRTYRGEGELLEGENAFVIVK